MDQTWSIFGFENFLTYDSYLHNNSYLFFEFCKLNQIFLKFCNYKIGVGQ